VEKQTDAEITARVEQALARVKMTSRESKPSKSAVASNSASPSPGRW